MSKAPEMCYVISTDNNHDGRMRWLRDVLEEYEADNAMPISCIPGRLGCRLGEGGIDPQLICFVSQEDPRVFGVENPAFPTSIGFVLYARHAAAGFPPARE